MQVLLLGVHDAPETEDNGVTIFGRVLQVRAWHDDDDQIESDLKDTLVANAGVAALVGERISVSRRVQGDAPPVIVIHRITGPHDYHMGGTSGLMGSVIQIDCWAADSWAQADQVRAAVVATLKPLAKRAGS